MKKVKAVAINSQNIEISTDYIKLDQFLKFCGAAESGSHAKLIISEGGVAVNGELCLMRGKKLYDGDSVKTGDTRFYVCKKA